jgi:hypothetical protein
MAALWKSVDKILSGSFSTVCFGHVMMQARAGGSVILSWQNPQPRAAILDAAPPPPLPQALSMPPPSVAQTHVALQSYLQPTVLSRQPIEPTLLSLIRRRFWCLTFRARPVQMIFSVFNPISGL